MRYNTNHHGRPKPLFVFKWDVLSGIIPPSRLPIRATIPTSYAFSVSSRRPLGTRGHRRRSRLNGGRPSYRPNGASSVYCASADTRGQVTRPAELSCGLSHSRVGKTSVSQSITSFTTVFPSSPTPLRSRRASFFSLFFSSSTHIQTPPPCKLFFFFFIQHRCRCRGCRIPPSPAPSRGAEMAWQLGLCDAGAGMVQPLPQAPLASGTRQIHDPRAWGAPGQSSSAVLRGAPGILIAMILFLVGRVVVLAV